MSGLGPAAVRHSSVGSAAKYSVLTNATWRSKHSQQKTCHSSKFAPNY